MSSQSTPPIAFTSLPGQIGVYRKYLALQIHATRNPNASLGGTLVLAPGVGREGTELAMASTIAGAAFLGIDPRPQRLKAAMRNNACDFMVNNLDEALRVLKNEIRKKQAVSVGLLGNAAEILPQIVERGVQPDFLADTSPIDNPSGYIVPTGKHADGASAASNGSSKSATIGLSIGAVLSAHLSAFQELIRRGARSVPFHAPAPSVGDAECLLVLEARNFQDLNRIEALVLAVLPSSAAVRRRWLEGARSYFRRQTPLERVVSLHPAEYAAFLQATQQPSFRNTLQSSVTVHLHDGDNGSRADLEILKLP